MADTMMVRLVPLPFGSGWHFVQVSSILAVKWNGAKKSTVLLTGNIQLEVTEDTHVVNKRIEDFMKFISEQQ
ncbi:MAG: hypothetical protein C5B58_06325 [Acidobacteria bacterium]|nr:MAG: hypothetical protein C5B58_06325 [Acidobacteriota bacterium]